MADLTQVREHMDVVEADGSHVGTVDKVEGVRIKLAKSDSSDGEHHYIMVDEVDGVENDQVRLVGGTPSQA